MKMKYIAFLSAALSLAACSSSGGGKSPSLPETEAVWMRFGTGEYELKLTSFAGACDLEQQGTSHKADSRYAAFHFTLPSGSDDVAAGDYPFGPTGNVADMTLKTLDSSCNTAVSVEASGGKITLSDAMTTNGGDVHGSYSITMADGSVVSGTFAAASCPLPSTPTSGTCVQ